METVIPSVKALFSTKVTKQKTSVRDAVLAEYEQFDDYLEMVIQFGVRKQEKRGAECLRERVEVVGLLAVPACVH